MARKINNIAEVKVFINGRAQAEKELDALRQKAKLYADQMEMANNIMLANADDPTKFKEYNSAKKDFELYRSELKKTDKAIKETEKLQVDLAEALNHLSDQNITRLKSLQRQLEAVRNKVEGTEDPDNDFLRYLNESIKKVSDTIKNKKGDLVEFENIIKNLGKASPKELEMVKNRLQDLIRVTELGTSELKTYEDQLRQITEEEKLRKAVAAEQVMSNLKGNSVEQIREAVHATEQLRDAHQRGSDDWEKYNKQIDDANNFLKSYETESKKAAALKVADNLDIASTSEMKESVEFLTRYRDTLSSTDDEYKDIQAAIDRTSESLKNFNSATRMEAMEKQFEKLNDLSVSALSEQKKYWQDVYNSAQAGSEAYNKAFDNLVKIRELEESRTKKNAEMDISAALSGNWDRTIEDTQKAIKLIEDYKKQLHVKTDSSAIDEANRAIEALNASLGKAKDGLMDYSEAFRIANEISSDVFDGTSEDIEKARKSLEAYRKTLKQKTDADTIKKVDEALLNVAKSAESARRSTKSLDDILEDLDSASVEDLEEAAKQLKEQLKEAERGTADYAREAAKLRDVNLELKRAKKEWEGQENVIMRTAKRLAAYVAVYGGYNMLAGYAERLFDANLKLSDSFADIQKTTGLADEEIKKLSRSINEIDTRTTQEELHELAAVAGQIGLKSTEDVLGFVKASNMITVSLNELGSEGTASLMKLAQLTGDVQELGVEKSLLAIGSAINELSANSAATAGPIVELMRRMGGIAAQSSITTAEMAAIGATADAIGQSMEITGTSMNKFIATLLSDSDQIAYALNMDAKALNELIAGGETMEAMLLIFERMGEMGGISKLAPVMGDLGSEGARMTQMLSAMAKNVSLLRDQVELSREAFDEAVSIENEYNIKNENAIALLERMKNTIGEMWVNSSFVSGFTWFLKQLNDLIKWLAEGDTGARLFKTTMIALSTAIALASMHLDSFCKALFKAKTYTELFSGAWGKLGKMLKANWISLVVGALVSLLYYLKSSADYMSKLTRATSEYNSELDRENNIMASLFIGAKNENLKKQEKAKIINEINKRYEKYLGFLVSERDGVKELSAAYELANAKMRESMASRMSNKQMEILDEDYAERMAEDRRKLMSVLEDGQYTAGREKEAMSAIRKITMDNLDQETKDIRLLISNEFTRLFGQSSAFAASEIKRYIETQKEYYKEFSVINEQSAEDLQNAQEATAAANVKVMEEMFQQVQDLSSGSIKVSAEGPFKTALDIQRGIVQEGEQFIDFATSNLENLSKDQRAKVQSNIDLVKKQMEEARSQLPETDAWGKEVNLKGWKNTLDNIGTASLDSLVSTYKELRDAPKLISDVMKYNRMFGTSFESLGEVMEDTHNKAEQIKKQLASMGRTTTGDFLWGKGHGSSEEENEAKKEYDAVMAALKTHFLKKKKLIQDNYLFEKITGEEMNRQIESNEEAFLLARIQLRKKLLGEANSFHQEKYEELAGKDIEKTGAFLREKGDVIVDGIKKNIEEDEVTWREGMIKVAQGIEEELLKYDIFGKFEAQFSSTMDKLEIMTSDLERKSSEGLSEAVSTGLSDEDFKKKIQELVLLADKSYTVNAEGLRKLALEQTEYYKWWDGLNDKQLEIMLQKLRDYYDNVTLLREQYQKRMEREFEGMYKQTGKNAAYEEEKQDIEHSSASLEQLEGYGVRPGYNKKKSNVISGFSNEYKKLQDKKKFYEQAIKDDNDRISELEERLAVLKEGTQEYLDVEKEIKTIKEGNEYIAMTTLITNTELAQNELLAQSQRDLTQVYMDEWTKRAEKMGQWGETLGDFLGEYVMLERQANKAREKGDLETAKKIDKQRKESRQALIQNLLGMIVDEAALWAKEYALKMMFNSLMISEDKRRAIEEVSLEGKKSTLSILLSALTGQAKEQSKGIPGLVTGAIIFAATMALQAFAKSAISNMFPEADSGDTNRKLSIGMLTYAKGNYPVLGDDGKVYDAKYEGSNLKTGIYGGGAHFGIFSEKQPEMIVDGKTTRKLILNYPYIYDAITTIAKNGRLVNAMPTFSAGDYPAGMRRIATDGTAGSSASAFDAAASIQEELAQSREINRQLLVILQNGIVAHLDGLENYRQQKKNERFLKRRGID